MIIINGFHGTNARLSFVFIVTAEVVRQRYSKDGRGAEASRF